MDAVPLSAGYELHSPHTFAVLLSILYTRDENGCPRSSRARFSRDYSMPLFREVKAPKLPPPESES